MKERGQPVYGLYSSDKECVKWTLVVQVLAHLSILVVDAVALMIPILMYSVPTRQRIIAITYLFFWVGRASQFIETCVQILQAIAILEYLLNLLSIQWERRRWETHSSRPGGSGYAFRLLVHPIFVLMVLVQGVGDLDQLTLAVHEELQLLIRYWWHKTFGRRTRWGK